MIRLYGGRTMPCILRIGARMAGAWPIALIAMIWAGVIDDRPSLPSRIDSWIDLSRSAGSCRWLPSRAMTAPTALPPSAEARCDCLALRPTGTIATIVESGSASSSRR